MPSRSVSIVAALALILPASAESQMPGPRVVVVNPPSNPVPVMLADSPAVTVAGPVRVQQASAWNVQILGTPTVALSPDSGTRLSAVRTATVSTSLDRNNQCRSLYAVQGDPANPSGRIWLIESANGRILAPSEDQVPPIELRVESPSPDFFGFTLHSFYLGVHRAKVAIGSSGVNLVFNDRVSAYAIRSQAFYPQVCFTVPVDYEVYVDVTFTGRLLDCADGPNACP